MNTELIEFEPIYISKGLYNPTTFNFSDFAFNGGTVTFTVREASDDAIVKTVTITEAQLTPYREFVVEWTPDETKVMDAGYRYAYDLVHNMGGKPIPLCLPSRVRVYVSVGGVR